MIRPINFGASHLKNINIKKHLLNTPASIVKIDPENKDDSEALDRVVQAWHGDKYANRICHLIKYGYCKNVDGFEVFALTTQDQGFEKLDSTKILGVMQTSNLEDKCSLDFIQVKPDTNSQNIFRKYKHVGSSLVKFLQTKHPVIELDADPKAVKFYEKLGFVKIKDKENEEIMEWQMGR